MKDEIIETIKTRREEIAKELSVEEGEIKRLTQLIDINNGILGPNFATSDLTKEIEEQLKIEGEALKDLKLIAEYKADELGNENALLEIKLTYLGQK